MGQETSHANGSDDQEDISIPLWQYDRQKQKWSRQQYDEDTPVPSFKKFRVVTYNIWFSREFQPARFNALCDILCKSDAHIIGLQEMTVEILQHLLEQPFIRQRYYVSDVNGRTFYNWYGVILLIDSRLHVSNLNMIEFSQSTMGRRLLIAEIKLDSKETLHIGTVHLESLDNQSERARQLAISQNIFNRFPGSSILMGDFNINALEKENVEQFRALPNWIDLWSHLMGPDNRGYTYDTETNSMANYHSDEVLRSRCDRIILRSESIAPTQIQILGNKSVGVVDQISIFPSDHFALTALFEKK